MLECRALVHDDCPDADERIDALYRQFARHFRLRAAARGIPRHECEDLVHEAFRKAIETLKAPDGQQPDDMAAWLQTVFNNLIIDRRRALATRDRLLPLGNPDAIEAVHATRGDERERARIRQALIKLPRRYRTLFLLRHQCGYSVEQIAALEGRSPGTIGPLLTEAKKRFARELLSQDVRRGSNHRNRRRRG